MKKYFFLLCACAVSMSVLADDTVYPVAKRIAPAATVIEPTDVHYAIPEGCFWFGDMNVRSSYYYYMCSSIIAPAHTTINIKNDGVTADSYKWAYCDPEYYSYSMSDNKLLNADTRDLSFKVDSYNFVQAPTLSQTTGETTVDWKMPSNYYSTLFQFGGLAGDFIYKNVPGESENGYFGFMQYNFNSVYVNLFSSSDLKSYVFGKGDQTTEAGITGFAAMFHQPAAPYIIRGGVNVFMTVNCDDDAELTVTLRRASKVSDIEYDLGAELGHITLTGAQLKAMIKEPIGDDYLGFFSFKDFTLTNEDGDEESVMPLTVNTPIAVVLTGWQSSKFRKFEIFTNEQPTDENKNLDVLANSRIETSTFWTGGPYGNKAKARFKNFVGVVTLDAFFPVLHVEADEIEAPAEGSTKTLKVDRYRYAAPEPFKAECDADWISCTTANDKTVRAYGGTLELTIAPNEGEARSAVVVLTDTDGSRTELLVKQQAPAGVDAVVADSAKALLQGNNLTITGAKGIVNIYGASGMLMKTFTADYETSVSVGDLARGVYFVQFADGSALRFVK